MCPMFLKIEWTLLTEIVLSIFAAVFASPKRKRFYPAAMGAWGCVILVMIAAGKSTFGISLTMPGIFFSGRGLSLILGSLVYYLYAKIAKRTLSKNLGSVLLRISFAAFLINYQYLLYQGANVF